ncbi:hypothetical protein [Actinoplanes sp. NPDC051494]|uniref:hypothetical protein n=1 Tax=Actinoplanes sp. NPDC051494 TaxID=3363907 RepID=UPI00379EE225
MRSLEAKLTSPSASPPLKPRVRIEPQVSLAGNYAIYDFMYTLGATDATESDVFNATMSLNLVFRLEQPEALDADRLQAFGSVGVVEIAHPYVREMVHSLTFRMGLPPFVLDVAPPIMER